MDSKPLSPVSTLPLKVLQTPFCGELRSKKFYIKDEIITVADDYRDSSGHIFCYHTQMPIGPDGLAVDPEACGSDRICYRSAVARHEDYSVVLQRIRSSSEA